MARRDYGSGSIEKRGDKRWRVSVELPPNARSGKRQRRRFTISGTKRDAQQALRAALNERDHGGVDPTRLTTGEWLARWLDRRIADGAIGPRVSENYRTICRSRLGPAIGSVRLQDLRAEHVLELKDDLSRTLAPATVKKILGLLRQSLEAAVAAQLLVRNPASSVASPTLAGKTRERRALDESEIIRVLEIAEGTAYGVAIRFALSTGARQAELLGATWESIDLERGTYLVHQTLQHVGGEFQMLPPKTRNSLRTIELSDATVALLRRHRAAQNAERLRLGGIWQDFDLVFPAADGRPQYRQSFYRGFRRIVGTAEIEATESVNWHSLRHTAASLWIKAGVDLFTVSRRLGHGSASFTMDVYGHLLSGQQRQRPSII